jgi:hypothetical protein
MWFLFVVEKDMVGKGEPTVLGYAFIVCILPLQLAVHLSPY